MVSEQQDMLGYDDAEPSGDAPGSSFTVQLIEQIAENGEAIVTFDDGRTVEFHGSDSHFYVDKGVMFTETDTPDGEDAESWFLGTKVVSVQRH